MIFVLVYFFVGLACCATAVAVLNPKARVSFFEPGTLFSVVAFSYSVIPLLAFALYDGLKSDISVDSRLGAINPVQDDIVSLGWVHFVLFATSTFTYLMFRSRLPGLDAATLRTSAADITRIAAVYAGLKGTVWVLLFYFGVSSSSDYLSSYLALQSLPRFGQQVVVHLGGMATTSAIFLCVALISHPTLRWLVPVWILAEGLLVFLNAGARTGLFVIALSSLVGFHYLVRRISSPLIAALIVMGILTFLGLGAYRDLGLVAEGSDIALQALIRNEFVSVFINGLDVVRLREAGLTSEVSSRIYYADLVNVVPQQLLDSQKLDLSVWYVQSFYPAYAAAGGGLAFGIVPESLVGNGLPDAAVRGIFLGIAFAVAHAALAGRRNSLWATATYVWILVFAYKVYRTSTLHLVPVFLLDALPAIALLAVLIPRVRVSPKIRAQGATLP